MSTPTKNDDRHEIIEVKPDYDEDEERETIQEVMKTGKKPWWYWFRIDVPKKPQQRADFVALLLAVLVVEWITGPIIGWTLRGIFGWPF